MNLFKKTIALIAMLMVGAFALTACGPSEATQRKDKQNSVTLENSLEKANLKEKLERENDPTATRYVYLMNFGQIVGYYVIEGKVSSSGSQLGPEQEVINACSSSVCPVTVDSAQDDGTYGTGDPGIFFFLADGTMVSTDLNHVQVDAPMELDVPLLGK